MAEEPSTNFGTWLLGCVLAVAACILALPSFVVVVMCWLAWSKQFGAGGHVNANVPPMTVLAVLGFGAGIWMAFKARRLLEQGGR